MLRQAFFLLVQEFDFKENCYYLRFMLTNELKNATDIVKEAGRILLEYYHQDYEIEFKKGDGPVTEADKASNDFIVSGLREFYPDDGILSEESKDDFKRLEKDRVWSVDPMDGTREFIDKVGQLLGK